MAKDRRGGDITSCDRCNAIHDWPDGALVEYRSVATNENPIAHAHLCEPCSKGLDEAVVAAAVKFVESGPSRSE